MITTPNRFVASVVLATLLASAALVLAHPLVRNVSGPHVADFARGAPLPQTMLWAWERPEDLTAIDPHQTGVAFLARTVFLAGDGVSVRPRFQPLRVPPGTALVAVVRVETSRVDLGRAKSSRVEANRAPSPSLSSHQRSEAAHSIAVAGQLPGLAGLQIDFDATASERSFYSDLLQEVRAEIPPDLPLSITALASWCLGDNWLKGLPVDDAIPMLFRMGAGTREVELHLDAGRNFRAPVCRQSLGISTDEPVSNLPQGRRLYIFTPRAWTPGTIELATHTTHLATHTTQIPNQATQLATQMERP